MTWKERALGRWARRFDESKSTLRQAPLSRRRSVLKTDRLRMEPLARKHARALYEVLRHEDLYHHIPQRPPQSSDALRDTVRRWEKRRSPEGDETWLNWAVLHQGECAGQVQATIRPDGTALLAYLMSPKTWGHGLATEACQRVICHLFDDYGVTLICAEVDTRNRRSIRLLERLGFVQAAFRADADFFHGRPSDEFTYVLERPQQSG